MAIRGAAGMRKFRGKITDREAIAFLDTTKDLQAGDRARYFGPGDPMNDCLAIDATLGTNNSLVQMPCGVAVTLDVQSQRFMKDGSISPDRGLRFRKFDDCSGFGSALPQSFKRNGFRC